jgi:hypothetical protein
MHGCAIKVKQMKVLQEILKSVSVEVQGAVEQRPYLLYLDPCSAW